MIKPLANQQHYVGRILDVALAKADHAPASISQFTIASRVPVGALGMPVIAVRLNGYAITDEREVDEPGTDRELLRELNAKRHEGEPDAALQLGLASELAVAGARAVRAWRARQHAEADAASPAVSEDGWAPALLRAVAAVQPLLRPEATAASLAVDVLGRRRLARLRAHGIAMRDGAADGVVLIADRAVLCHRNSCAGSLIARPRAIGAVPVPDGPEFQATSLARTREYLDRRCVITGAGAIGPFRAHLTQLREKRCAMGARIGERHPSIVPPEASP